MQGTLLRFIPFNHVSQAVFDFPLLDNTSGLTD
jgi:hypothetical protein